MKLIKLSNQQRLAVILPVFFVTIIFLLCAWNFFITKEVSYLTEKCYSDGGYPNIQLFTFDYSFSCD
ncbi:MAG TPA: hypothetical protein DCO80_08845 [Ornithinibacillus sp.]|nr:hypothetical protein [Ornithinibacillus sp.]